MNDVLAAKRKLQFLTIAQWLSGIFTVAAYIVSALNYINQQTITIVFPFLFIGLTGRRRSKKNQLIKLCHDALVDLKQKRDTGEIDGETFSIESHKIREILFAYFDGKGNTA